MYIANLEYFFIEDHADDATKLIHRNVLGLDKLKTLYRIICNPREPHKRTPSEYFGTLADGLGPFSMLVSVYNQLLDISIQAPINERPLGGASKRIRFYDATRPSAVVDPTSSTRQTFLSEEFRMGDIDMTDVGYQPIARCPTHACPPAATSVDPTDKEPPRRTPTEALVADFLVTLLGGLASLVQALNPRPLCIANSFETTYTFGPVRNTSQQVDVTFRARINGSIPFSLSLAGMPREVAIFEAQRAARGESGGSIPVFAQQSMEHVAYIWKRHVDDPKWKTRVKTYHTFMVAQDHQPVRPTQGEIPFLEIQEFGPFDVTNEEELGKFLHIMLSFILWQLEQTESSKEALS
ncbi:hypothetical protein AJ78_02304 [Emergomyces pasteurianus Ep9510]|uniref:Uncharacterized protein n=1 Tax=Emergomyces pasteurianus Ep9510 TaxID=1447872 RepID=A0A1J9QQR5_9EURO|nr:hypothetical protein AJ78_02304 [Emergomyces pasteurianus Ep9510]